MEQYELEMESGLKLSRQGAQSIVEEVGAVVGQNINMMDRGGYVIASTDETRIGSLHEGARKLIGEHLPELYVEAEHATSTSRPGLNLPITHGGSIVGVIGITGLYGEVVGYGQVVKKMVEILIRENAEQDERRMGQRVLNRFLEDWVIGSGLMQPRILEERGFALGIDIAVPRRVMVASARELEEYASTASGQKLLEQVEREAASLAGRGSLVLRSGGRQIILVKKCPDRQMEQLAGRIRTAVFKKFNIRMVVGIDGRAEDIHVAYGQANKAWRSAGLAKKDILAYDSVTLELFTEDLGDGVKAEYIHKLFKKCGYEELCQWMGLLEAYFEAEGSLKAASEKLHVHKNTLTYRLKRLEELTGYDVRLVSQSTVFYMAMLFFRDVKDGMEEVL
ncbi:helix-turn-helix domain-containing protein [Lachnoclostridium pacaense]|uniref:CdaR family transcriptional regulator n=1 Tax=Enterocloster hominis (ex Hitch et al. 2024) TaxID=1917870 RepID=UPI001D11BE08|nr:sugar diacid recognition domain-containing protein [Lachnoclostridium pacaense]MCC2878842.1 helix-turn-helix domain-containing protein [Lachnoclostridium pacaense]